MIGAEGGYEGGGGGGGGGGDGEEEGTEDDLMSDNCTHPRQPLPRYNDSCEFVHEECEGKAKLIDYLSFVLCDLPKAQVKRREGVGWKGEGREREIEGGR